MSQLIPNEIPSWTIDGVNKVFTFLNEIDYITTLTFDGAEYTNFIVDSNDRRIVTLVDAPIVSIYADYYPLITQTDVSTTCTFWDIKEKVWNLLWQKSTSTNFSNTIVWQEINIRGEEIWLGRVVNKLNPQQSFRAWELYFKNWTTNVRIQAWWKLTNAFNIADLTALTDTTNLLGAWYVEIGWDVVKYTSKTSTSIDWTSGQTINHLTGEEVIQLYEMPEGINKPSKVELITTGYQARQIEIPLDNTDTYGRYYQIIRKDWKTLLKIVWLKQDNLVTVSYIKEWTNMSANTDNCPFPWYYWISVLAYIVAGSLWYDKGIPNSQQHLSSGYSSLNMMYGQFNNETNVIKQHIKPKAYRFNSINR